MTELTFDLPSGAPRAKAGIQTEIMLKLNGEPDQLWCDLFSQGLAAVPPHDDDVLAAVSGVYAGASGIVQVFLAPLLPDGVILRVLNWVRELAAATSLRREALERDAQRVQQLAARWSDDQIV